MKKHIIVLIATLTLTLSTLTFTAGAFAEKSSVLKPDVLEGNKTTEREPATIKPGNYVIVQYDKEINEREAKDLVSVFEIKRNSKTKIPVKYRTSPGSKKQLIIERQDGAPFTEGEEFVVEKRPTSKSNDSMTAVYFAVNYNFTLAKEGIPQLNSQRNLVVCVSDIHLGANDNYGEFVKNKEYFNKFLNQVKESPNVKELVIAGDLFDEWYVPAEDDTLGGKKQQVFLQSIAKNNKAIITTLNGMIKEKDPAKKIKITYVPGNHDLLFTKDEVDSILPGINQARDVQGLGAYSPEGFPKAIIEHGHRYNFYCAPDPISNAKIAPGSILPPGYFFTRIATTSLEGPDNKPLDKMREVTPNTNVAEGTKKKISQDLLYDYWSVWKNLMEKLPVKKKFSDPFIKTNINGFKDTYSINDIMPYQIVKDGHIDLKVSKGIQDSWNRRQDLNKVQVLIPTQDAIKNGSAAEDTDKMADIQYFSNPKSDKRIVLFGHTHVPRIRSYKKMNNKKINDGKAIYANTGTWIDKNIDISSESPKLLPTMTFVVLTPQKTKDSMPTFVNLYQYSPDGDCTRLVEGQVLTDLDK